MFAFQKLPHYLVSSPRGIVTSGTAGSGYEISLAPVDTTLREPQPSTTKYMEKKGNT